MAQTKREITPEVRTHLKDALYHMVAMWDALRELETELDTEVEEEDISGCASDLDTPEDAYRLTDALADEYLEAIK